MNRDLSLSQATAFHRAGHYLKARELYERLLVADPRDPDALHLLGVLFIDVGNFQRAETLIRRAIKIRPSSPLFHFHYGLVLSRSGRAERALRAYIAATTRRSDYAEAYAAAGRASFELGRFDQALSFYDKAIAIKSDPVFWSDKSTVLLRLGKDQLALEAVETALRLNAGNEAALCNKALIFQRMSRLDDALLAADNAIARNRKLVQAYINRSAIYIDLGRFEEAVADCQTALTLDAKNVGANANMGAALLELRRPKDALVTADNVLMFDSKSTAALFNKAMSLRDLRRFDEAISVFDKLIELDSGFEQAYWEKSVACLSLLQFETGWPLYERRKKKPFQTAKPRYCNDSPTGTRLLVWGEQGIGDEIFFAATLSQLERLSSKTIVQTDKRLIGLLSRSFPSLKFQAADQCVPENEYDYYLQLGSVFNALQERGIKHESWRETPYLKVDQARVDRIRTDLSRHGRRLCGVAWRSQKAPYSDAKSMSLYDLVPVFGAHDVDYVSLQYGDVATEIQEFQARTGLNVQEYAGVDNFNDLDGHAALIEACDYVITVSNTTAHIAGALGKSGFVALPHARGSFFYWALRDDGRSYWYPSLACFIQTEDESWSEVTRRIANKLT